MGYHGFRKQVITHKHELRKKPENKTTVKAETTYYKEKKNLFPSANVSAVVRGGRNVGRLFGVVA